MERRVSVLLEQPWRRVKIPAALPEPLSVAALSGLAAEEFAVLLRDHLVPRNPAGVDRERWERLWAVLSRDDALSDRAFDVLEEFLDQVDRALRSDALDAHQRRRAQKFERFCDDAWQRLRVDDDKPLGWAGRAAAGFNPPARKVLEQLVDAVAQHRSAVTAAGSASAADEQLWAVLRHVDLDPDLSRRRR